MEHCDGRVCEGYRVQFWTARQEPDGSFLVLNFAGKALRLNETCMFILKSLSDACPLEDLRARVGERYEVNESHSAEAVEKAMHLFDIASLVTEIRWKSLKSNA